MSAMSAGCARRAAKRTAAGSTTRKDGPASSLPLHRAVLDAVIAREPQRAENAILVLIDGARADIDKVLASRKNLPRIHNPATRLKAFSL